MFDPLYIYLKPCIAECDINFDELSGCNNCLFRFYKMRNRNNVALSVERFPIVRETAKCYVIMDHNSFPQKEKFVRKNARKAYAYKEWRRALNSFAMRRTNYIARLETSLEESRVILGLAERLLGK